MHRCTRCILPESYPGLVFDEDGVCNYCNAFAERTYLGDEALKAEILKHSGSGEAGAGGYDCVIGLSGGRDSTYLLYHLVKVLGLKVLAYCVDNGFMPEQTRRNVENTVAVLGVDLVIETHDHLARCAGHHLSAFTRKPAAPMVGVLCTGCRLGLDLLLPDFAQRHGVRVLITGSNPLDAVSFKSMIMAPSAGPQGGKKIGPFVWGYARQVARNPRWLLDPRSAATQMREYYHHFLRGRGKGSGLVEIAPFYRYVRWHEQTLVDTIKTELRWGETPGAGSSWRGDCDLALLKLYLYKETLGYNDRDEGLSYLVRDGQVSRDEALRRLEAEGSIPEEVVSEIVERIGVSFPALKQALGA